MIFAEESAPDLFEQLLALLAAIVMPVWNDLIQLIPLVLVVGVVVYLLFTLWQWRSNGARNKPRLIPRYAGGAPPGVHMPGPSRWVAVVPLALAAIIFWFVLTTIGKMPGWPWGGLLILLAIILPIVAVIGWLRDASREWRETEYGHAAAGQLPAGAATGVLTAGSTSSAVALVPARAGALVPASGTALATGAEERQPPPGVHMPGPSPWPFFAPIALMVIFYGVIFSPALIVGGVVMGVIAAAGWLLDANREYTSTEAVGHAVPRTRDPRAVWPRRLLSIYVAVIVVSLIITGLPAIGQFLAGLAPPPPGETPVAVPAQPEISASTAVSFDTTTLVVPAGRAFQLVFHNNQDGVPHNVEIADGPDKTTIYFSGQQITGVDSITYQVPNLEAKNYFFFCVVHQNMNGTVQAIPEAGPGGGPEGPPTPGASPSAATP
jgi:hypothetical protein